MKKEITLVLTVDVNEPWETDDYIKKDLAREINCAGCSYELESIEIKDADNVR